MLDANGPALRTLLGILNEHQFKRGRQQENANLHTAIASTNESPENAVKKDGSLGAVLDRFIFHGEVDYLETPESRLKMYAKYLSGAKPSTTITYEEVQAASGIVTGPCQIDNPVILETYDKVLTRFRDTNPSISISDRRACKLMKCMEANAILNGRYEVQLDDIYAVGYGLCVAGNEKEFETFYQIAKEEIDAKKAEATDEVVMKLLESYEQQIPALGPNPTADELRAIMKSVHQLRSDCEAQVTADNPTARKKEAILDQLEQVQTTAMDIMVRG
jgi:MoxR-like ATPase